MAVSRDGVGRAYSALSLAYRAVQAGHEVRFLSAADLMLQLALACYRGEFAHTETRPVGLVVDAS